MKNTYAMRIRGAFHTSTHRKIFKVGEIKAKDNFISYCVQLNSVKYTHTYTHKMTVNTLAWLLIFVPYEVTLINTNE